MAQIWKRVCGTTPSVGGETVQLELESKVARQDSGSHRAWAAVGDLMDRADDQSLVEVLCLHYWRKMTC